MLVFGLRETCVLQCILRLRCAIGRAAAFVYGNWETSHARGTGTREQIEAGLRGMRELQISDRAAAFV